MDQFEQLMRLVSGVSVVEECDFDYGRTVGEVEGCARAGRGEIGRPLLMVLGEGGRIETGVRWFHNKLGIVKRAFRGRKRVA